MDNIEGVENNVKIYKKLEERKRTLELKISEKCYELKKLCVAEAELTGVIPMEIPLEPDESPPKIKRRVGTMYPFTEDVIHQLKLPDLPTVGKSPKRKTPLCPWNKSGSGNFPSRVPQPASLSPRQQGTWSPGQKQASPASQTSHRSHSYKAKLNILKKW